MDRKKYIVEASDDVKKVIALGVTHGGAIWTDTTDIENLEELNSDYINEHFGDLQDDAYNKGYAQCQDDYGDALKHAKDTAYKKGLHDGESKCRYCNEYQRGLNEAWEAAKKILQMYDFTVFGLEHDGVFESLLNEGQQMTPQEAIERLKSYEDDKIKRGDIVNVKGSCNDDLLGVVTKVWEDNCYIMWDDGSGGAWCKKSVAKTGKHIDVDKFLGGLSSNN